MQVVYVPAAHDERAGEWQGRVGVAARGGKHEGGLWHRTVEATGAVGLVRPPVNYVGPR